MTRVTTGLLDRLALGMGIWVGIAYLMVGGRIE